MTDLVSELRAWADGTMSSRNTIAMLHRAADEIERLRGTAKSHEDQLVRLANFIGKDARHAPKTDMTVAGAVIAEIERLRAVLDVVL